MSDLAEDLIQGAEAIAVYLGLERRQVYHMIQAGALPVVRVGRRIYARKTELNLRFSSTAC